MSDVLTNSDYFNVADHPEQFMRELSKYVDIRMERIAWPMVGTVTSQNLSKYAVSVQLRDYPDVTLVDVPVIVQYIGKTPQVNETGEWKLPNLGNLVILMFANGSWDDPIVMGQLYNDIDKAPYIKREPIPFGHGPKRDLKNDDTDDYHIRNSVDSNFTLTREGNFTLDHKTNAHITIDDGGNVVIHSNEKDDAMVHIAQGTDQTSHLVIKFSEAFLSAMLTHLQHPFGPNIARIGDKVSCGGVIVTGAPTAFCADYPDTSTQLG